eukprot:2617608-Pyramimonas_sp.AAC.1
MSRKRRPKQHLNSEPRSQGSLGGMKLKSSAAENVRTGKKPVTLVGRIFDFSSNPRGLRVTSCHTNIPRCGRFHI